MEPHVPLDGSECLVIIDQTHPLPVCLPGGLQEGPDVLDLFSNQTVINFF